MNRSLKTRWQRVPLIVTVAAVAACQSGPRTSNADREAASRRAAFAESLVQTTDAINAGDLETAHDRLAGARIHMSMPGDEAKVASLEHLLAGAESLMSGDADSAWSLWARIEDPGLGAEVRAKARLIGMAAPDTPLESERLP